MLLLLRAFSCRMTQSIRIDCKLQGKIPPWFDMSSSIRSFRPIAISEEEYSLTSFYKREGYWASAIHPSFSLIKIQTFSEKCLSKLRIHVQHTFSKLEFHVLISLILILKKCFFGGRTHLNRRLNLNLYDWINVGSIKLLIVSLGPTHRVPAVFCPTKKQTLLPDRNIN